MTQKKKELIEAICDEFGFDYPSTEDGYETEEEAYEWVLTDYNFTSWCYVNNEWLSLAKLVEIAENAGLLEDDF